MFFKNWQFLLANYMYIIHQLESESISFLLGQRNGSEPDQFFSLTAFLPTHMCASSSNNDNLTARIKTNNA
jgi:hypothetical protein